MGKNLYEGDQGHYILNFPSQKEERGSGWGLKPSYIYFGKGCLHRLNLTLVAATDTWEKVVCNCIHTRGVTPVMNLSQSAQVILKSKLHTGKQKE